MLVRSQEVHLQSQVKELGRARTTTGIHVEMQHERLDAYIQKERKEEKLPLWVHQAQLYSLVLYLHPGPCSPSWCHQHHPTAPLNKRDGGSSQQPLGIQEMRRRQGERGGENKVILLYQVLR